MGEGLATPNSRYERRRPLCIGGGGWEALLREVRVYRTINATDRLFGLELADGAALLFVFFSVFMINREGLISNFFVLACAYAAIRAVKRGKPDGYALDLLRFLVSSRLRIVGPLDEAETFETHTAAGRAPRAHKGSR